MSLATRCPACGTTFRIEPDQLALADGWARCGRCSAVFDAAAERREHPDDVVDTAVASAPGPGLTLPPAPAPSDADAFGAALLNFRLDAPPPSASSSRTDDPFEAPEEVDERAPATPAAPESLSPPVPPGPPAFDPWRELPSLSLGPDPVSPAQGQVPAPASMATQADSPPPVASVPPAPVVDADTLWPVPPSASTEPAMPGASGVRPAARAESVAPAGVIHAASEPVAGERDGAHGPRGTGRRRSWRVAIVVVVIVLLAVALLAQVLHRQRDVLAAHHPALRPALAGLCGLAGCTMGPLRRPGDIAIESATFTHVQDSDRYRLAFVLRNQADVPLAVPAIELSLLDVQERAVVRRVLMPPEFGVSEATLPTLAERAGAVSFALDGPGDGEGPPPRIAGYAMVAFYP